MGDEGSRVVSCGVLDSAYIAAVKEASPTPCKQAVAVWFVRHVIS